MFLRNNLYLVMWLNCFWVMYLIRNTNSDNEGSVIFNLLFSCLVGCGFCVFETGSYYIILVGLGLCVDQAGLEIGIILPLSCAAVPSWK